MGLTKRLHLENSVDFIGAVEQTDLVPYYQKADLLMLPSEHESFGMVMVEAMACGTPVVALKGSGGPDEIIENGINGILCDRQDLFKSILEYLSSSSQQTKMREAARRSVEDNWSISATIEAFRKSVQDVFS